MELQQFLRILWEDYLQLSPQVRQIVFWLRARGEQIENDHIALRSFGKISIGGESIDLGIGLLAQVFCNWGYESKENYVFSEKKLRAKHFEHPDKKLPKIFISELESEKLSQESQVILTKVCSEINVNEFQDPLMLKSGRRWDLSFADYIQLSKESEYAAWLCAFGFRPNHFTISINHLNSFKSLEELNTFILSKGIALNQSGGEIKGSASEGLEQSSTLAANVELQFSDIRVNIPSCYFEFAKRYTMANGELFQGFLEKSADRIFESTDRQKS